MKIAFLTCNATSEITSCISVLSSCLEKKGIAVQVKDAVDLLPGDAPESFVVFYANHAVSANRPFDFLSAGALFDSRNRCKSPVYAANALYAEQLRHFLQSEEIDAVICFQIYQAQAVTYLKRCCGCTAKLILVLPDYQCPEWIEETAPDVVFAPHEDLIGQMTARGADSSILALSGIPVADKFHYSSAKADARNSLDLPIDVPCYLIRYGGEGFGEDPILLIRKLIERSRGEDLRIIVMTGRNAALADSIRTRFTADPRVKTVPFSEQVSKYMDACDVMLTKPDVISLTESGVKGLPFVCSVPSTRKERQTVSFFASHQLCSELKSFDQIVEDAVLLGQNEEARDQRFILLKQNIPQKAADKICGTVCSMLQFTEDAEDQIS